MVQWGGGFQTLYRTCQECLLDKSLTSHSNKKYISLQNSSQTGRYKLSFFPSKIVTYFLLPSPGYTLFRVIIFIYKAFYIISIVYFYSQISIFFNGPHFKVANSRTAFSVVFLLYYLF